MNVYEKWKTNLKTSNPTSLDVAAYAIARSLNTEDPLGKALYLLYACFPPIKNKHKLLNGKYPYSFLESIVSSSRMHESSKIYSHNKLKSALLDIFDIPNSKELNELLMDISKNIDVNYSKPYSYVVVRSDLE